VTKDQVRQLCEQFGPRFNIDPALGLAICSRESGSGGGFSDDACRLEEGFYRRYTAPGSLSTTTEVLLACSYGLMQVMGQSLREIGFFDFFKTYNNQTSTFQLQDPLSEVSVPKGINAFMVRPAWQVEWGMKWFTVKLKLAGGSDVRKALQLWNGGGNPNYASEVIVLFDAFKREGIGS